MPLTQINSNAIAAGVITADKLAAGVGGGPKITNIEVTNNSYTVLDDTAVDTSGGYIKLTGTGFAAGCQVVINNTPATSTTFTSSTEVRAQVPAQSAGTYVVYLVNSDGGVAIRVNGITYSATPSWVTSSTLTGGQVDQAISIQLSATGASTYALAAGSSLPAGLTLTSGGLLSGTVTGLAAETTYSFTINAVDTENQDSPRTFSLTISVIVADPYFNRTTLLLQGNGTNNATNNTFLDSSTNNFTITRNGNTTQGTFSPFSPTGWSNYFDGTGDYLAVADNAALQMGTGNFTIEFWINFSSISGYQTAFDKGYGSGIMLQSGNGTGRFAVYCGGATSISESGTATPGVWIHYALVRSGSTLTLYRDGIASGSTTNTANLNDASSLGIGANASHPEGASSFGIYGIRGYISNFRIVKGTAVYTANFTPSTTPLTAIANTSLLTCQSNRFVDNSSNAFAITRNGDTSVQAFSPFAPAAAWSAGTNGGSAYFDGSSDWLSVADNEAFNLGSGNFTIECWVYPTAAAQRNIFGQVDSSFNNSSLSTAVQMQSNRKLEWQVGVGSSYYAATSTSALPLNVWTHVAFVRNGNTGYFYFNGVQDATTFNLTGYTLNNSSSDFSVGRPGEYNSAYWPGYIADFRLVKGTAVYTSNFTPPTAPVTAIANTSLLLNSTNAGIYDATAKNVIETVGNAQVSTSVKKYGSGSMSFDGSGDRLHLRSNDRLMKDLGTGNFTVEGWVYVNSLPAQGLIISLGAYNTPSLDIYLDFSVLSYSLSSNGSSRDIASGVSFGSALSAGQWYHFALVRNGNTFTPYLNGVAGTTSTSSSAVWYAPGELTLIGGYNDGTNISINGYIDDLRITKGYARYTANFTPPTSEFAIQ